MYLTKLALLVLLMMTLTTTWARSVSKYRQETNVNENARNRDISMKRKMRHHVGTISANNSEEDNELRREEKDEEIVRYTKSDAEKFLRKFARIADKRKKEEIRRRRSVHGNDEKIGGSISARRFQKMLDKAILKIITGDLTAADMLLLKNFNYSHEEVLAIRERELAKKNNFPIKPYTTESKIFHDQKMNNDLEDDEKIFVKSSRTNKVDNYKITDSKKRTKSIVTTVSSVESSSERKNVNGDFDFDAYNKQAIMDYENIANKISSQSDLDGITSSADYDNRSSDNNAEARVDVVDNDDIRTSFNRAMEPHVVFKIRYDDSEFDSSSSERFKQFSRERNVPRVITKIHDVDSIDNEVKSKNTTDNLAVTSMTNEFSLSSRIDTTTANNGNKTFRSSNIDALSSVVPVVHKLGNFVTQPEDAKIRKSQEEQVTKNASDTIKEEIDNATLGFTETSAILRTDDYSTSTVTSETLVENNVGMDDKFVNNETNEDSRKKSIYEGLEWIEDDVYRVIPEADDSPNYYDGTVNDMDNDTIEDTRINETLTLENERRNVAVDDDVDDNDNDTIGYQNESPEDDVRTQTEDGYSSMINLPNVNPSTYQQLALAHRRDGNVTSPFDSQGQKAIEDIKMRVLAMTGRFNLSSSGNQVQRERLTMFPTICQTPRNTDAEAWSDPFLMNMNFQLNLTSGDHVVAAKVRIYALPQENITVTTGGPVEEEDEEERKIRISIYFYTKSLKKHRSKKRLIDSVVISLTGQGSHWALDVRQALRFWRQNLRNSHAISNNHGLVIQVEDQDGRSLKPSQYIQQDSCHTSELNEDEKAYQRVPALFVQACSRYVRVVNGEPVTYVNCRKSSRNGRH